MNSRHTGDQQNLVTEEHNSVSPGACRSRVHSDGRFNEALPGHDTLLHWPSQLWSEGGG